MGLRRWTWSFVLLAVSGAQACQCGAPDDPKVGTVPDASSPWNTNPDGSHLADPDGGRDAGLQTDAATLDSSATDASLSDGGRTDAATSDASSTDGAVSDASVFLDAGATDAAVHDAGGSTDASTPADAGANRNPAIASVVATPDPFTGTAAIAATVSDPDTDEVECEFTVAVSGVSVTPSGFSSSCAATITEVDVPRQAVLVTVTARDSRGALTTMGHTVTIDNHPPSAAPGPDRSILPGETTGVSVSARDVDTAIPGNDSLTYQWTETTSSTPTAGVSLRNSTTATPTIVLDRASYVAGPAQQELVFSVRVADDRDAFATAEVRVTVLDERGPYVDNRSSWSGQGPAGYCGARTRPCSNIADAVVNLRSAIDDGAVFAPEVLVATTEADYGIAQELLLDTDVSLVCGYDATLWSWSAARTKIRFSSPYGIRVRSPVSIKRCDVEGTAGPNLNPLTERAAVVVETGGAVLDDDRLVGTQVAFSTRSAVGVKLAPGAQEDAPIVRNSEVMGGVGVDTAIGVLGVGGAPSINDNSITGGTGTFAIGVQLDGPVQATTRAAVSGNSITGGNGGSAAEQGAVGVLVVNGNAVVEGNVNITGATSGFFGIGVSVQATADNPTISNNARILGASAGSGSTAGIGVHLASTASLAGNAGIGGGTASTCMGIAAGGDNTGSDIAFSFTSTADSVVGCAGSVATGVNVANSVTATLIRPAVLGAAAGSVPLVATGVHVGQDGRLILEGGTVGSGNAANSATGVHANEGALSVRMGGATVRSGALALPGSISRGVAVESGTLAVELAANARTTIVAGTAGQSSIGLQLSCGGAAVNHDINGVDVTAGKAAGSHGLQVLDCGRVRSTGSSYAGGAEATTYSAGGDVTQTDFETANDLFTGGASTETSVGLRVVSSTLSADNLRSRGGASALSQTQRAVSVGLVLTDAVSSRMTGGEAVGGEVSGSAESLSVGLAVSSASDASVDGIVVSGARAASGSSTGSSAGALFGTTCSQCRLTDSNFTSQGAPVTTAFRIEVPSGAAMLGATIARNTITAANATNGGRTVGLLMNRGCSGCRINRNFVTSGAVAQGQGSSVGMELAATGPLADITWVTNNVVRTGSAHDMRALDVSGRFGDSIRFLHNNFHAAALNGASFSAAVYMGSRLDGSAAINEVGTFVGNLLDRGLAAQSFGFYENCETGSGSNVHARPVRARNNNFHPTGGTGYISTLSGNVCTSRINTTNIDTVNGTAPYDGDLLVRGYSYDVTPGFAADGFHIQGTSAMRNKSRSTYLVWNLLGDGPLDDIDGANREVGLGESPDIGVDER